MSECLSQNGRGSESHNTHVNQLVRGGRVRTEGIQWDVQGNTGPPLAVESSMFNEKSSFGSFVLTFVLGTIAGATVALLYAPMTGKKMQKKVANVTEKVRDAVEDSVDNVQSVLRKVANA
jgi:hypothetical protein